MKEFKINKFITLKLEDKETNFYIKGEPISLCTMAMINIPHIDKYSWDKVETTDELEEFYYDSSQYSYMKKTFDYEPTLSPEDLFWAFCSNVQVWAENGYNTNLLHSQISFPLLNRLTEVGDQVAARLFKDEIIRRIKLGYIPVVIYLCDNGYLENFTYDENFAFDGDFFENLLDYVVVTDKTLISPDVFFIFNCNGDIVVELIRKRIEKELAEDKYPYDYIGYEFIEHINDYIVTNIFWKTSTNNLLERVLNIVIRNKIYYITIDFVKIIEKVREDSIKLLTKVFQELDVSEEDELVFDYLKKSKIFHLIPEEDLEIVTRSIEK